MNRSPADIPLITDRLSALGEMVRLRILRILEREELTVGEVAKVFQMPQSTISRHLKVLADGGWLVRRSEGTAAHYRLVLDELPEVSRTLWITVRDQLGGPRGQGNTPELVDDLQRLAVVLAERREDSQAFFGRVAGQWDDVRASLFGSRFTALALLRLLPREWTVADLGCGTGNVAELLAPVVKRVIAVDRSEAMLEAARQRLASADNKNVRLVSSSLEKLSLADGSVDAALSFLVLHHVEKPKEGIREMFRITRPGGHMMLVDMTAHDREDYRRTMGHRWLGFDEPTIRSMTQGAGWRDVRYETLPPDADGRGPGLFVCTAHKPE
ncbi:MAG: ArsR family transcriptional regulator [Phycisphaeraceae bacterium]|nr:ArsR family transcriptional regulator [Phycisphaeraceae bacterium]